MISTRTITVLAETFCSRFAKYEGTGRGYSIYSRRVYDFLYEQQYDAFFCNAASNYQSWDGLKTFIQKLHTGESLAASTPDWDWNQRMKLGQTLIFNLCEDLLQTAKDVTVWERERVVAGFKRLKSALELDGYVFRDGRLLYPESEVLDTQEEQGVLQDLYRLLKLEDEQTTMHHLALSVEHYVNGKWGDAISNARMFLENTLAQVAKKQAANGGAAITNDKLSKPVEVRKYLEQETLLDTKETDALRSVYFLLSNAGSHPNMSESDQARLLRNMALIFAQFVMLRLKGRLKL